MCDNFQLIAAGISHIRFRKERPKRIIKKAEAGTNAIGNEFTGRVLLPAN
jgi:hypothetical protein